MERTTELALLPLAPMALLQDDFWTTIFHDDTANGCGITPDPYRVTSRSARMVSCFLELEKVNQDLESKLLDDFNSILNSMDKLSLSPTSESLPPLLIPPTRATSTHNHAFTTAAYSWLLENIANPYPSSTVKASLAQQYNCTLSAINTWFVNARRRTGWTALCRDHFNNCRADALDAAYRALVDEDPNRPLPSHVIHAFISVKATTESLYSSTLTKGALDAVVVDMTSQETVLVNDRHFRELKGTVEPPEALEVELQNEKPVAQHYFASPDCSCSSSPVPPLVQSLTDDSEEEEEVLPPVLAGRKRRLLSSEPATCTLSTKRRKRICSSTGYSLDVSSSLSRESLETRLHNQIPHSTLISKSTTNILASHQRHLSDATGFPKCPLGMTVEPPPQTVSDTIPFSTLESDHIIDEWFKNNFDSLFTLPPPVDVIEPDLSTQWEVELFSNYSIPGGPLRQPFKSFNSSTGDQPLTPVDSFVLDDFARTFENGTFIPPSEAVDPAFAISAADSSVPQAQDLSLSSDAIDWTALLNWQTSDVSLDSMFGQTGILPLPEIDLSLLPLP